VPKLRIRALLLARNRNPFSEVADKAAAPSLSFYFTQQLEKE
jgi:hypothetical protein